MGVLGDIIVDAAQDLLKILFNPITDLIEKNAPALIRTLVGTPHPDAVFSRPTNDAWPALYDFHWDTMVPLSLTLWAVAIGLVIFLETTSHLFSNYHRSKLKRRAFSGLIGILSWWWIAALSLRFMEALTGYLVPSLSNVSLFETISFSAMGVLGLVVALAANFTLFVLIGLIYSLRHIMLYLFVLLMPILIVMWIPGLGPFTLMSQFVKRLAGFFFPFLFMTVPVALLLRLGQLLGASSNLSMGGFGAWLVGLVIPLIAVVSPFVLFWQAGALFFMADRASQHVSSSRAKLRATRAMETSEAGAHGSRNLRRGLRGEPAQTPDGQTLISSGGSRAHAAGSRLRSTGKSIRNSIRRNGGKGGSGGGGGESSGGPTNRAENFDALRGRTSSNPTQGDSRDRRDSSDERPWYIN